MKLSSLSDLHVWIGLKNSDDQGTYFDLRAELRKNGAVIASGETKNIQGVTRNPDNAKEVTVAFSPISGDPFNPGDVLSIKILTKVADSGGHSNAVGLRLYYDAVSRPSRFGAVFQTVNEAPVATNDAYNTDEDTPLSVFAPGVLGNDNDVDDAQSTLTALLVSGPAHAASFALNANGSFSYMPSANFNGVDTFTYRAQDPHGAQSNLATVTITINPVNDAPVANNATATINSGTATSITLNANDIDSPSLSFAVGNSPIHGSLDTTSGTMTCSTLQNVTGTPGSSCTATVTYTPAASYSGSDSFTFTVNDGQATSNAATVSITVNLQAFRVTITSPTPGSTINAANILVRGVVDVPVGTEVGVTVNGFPAGVQGNTFTALVFVTPDTTSLTATAASGTGATSSHTITISVLAAAVSPVFLSASPLSGVAPLTVSFSLFRDIRITQVSFDANGDGVVDFSGSELNQYAFTFTQAGVYLATATANDTQGNLLTASAVIQVFDPSALNILLQAKWAEFRAALARNDIEGALIFVATSAKQKYRQAFQSLAPDLETVAATLRDMVPSLMEGGMMEYATTQDRDGDTFVHFIYFMLDEDGVWKIVAM